MKEGDSDQKWLTIIIFNSIKDRAFRAIIRSINNFPNLYGQNILSTNSSTLIRKVSYKQKQEKKPINTFKFHKNQIISCIKHVTAKFQGQMNSGNHWQRQLYLMQENVQKGLKSNKRKERRGKGEKEGCPKARMAQSLNLESIY